MTSNRRGAVLSMAAGAMYGACWLPWLPGWLIPVAYLLLLLALDRVRSAGQAIGVGTLYGLAAYGVAGHFLFALTRFSPAAAVLVLVMLGYAVPFTIASTWGAWRLERQSGVPRAIAFVPLYVVLEGARTWTDVSFPADPPAYALGDAPAWLAWAPMLGTHGVSLWLLLVALAAHAAVHSVSGRRRAWSAGIALLLWLAPPLSSPWLEPRIESGPFLRAGIVQPVVAIDEKFDLARHPAIWDRLTRLSTEVAADVDIVVWPESARPRAVRWDDDGPFVDPMMNDLARRLAVPVLYGTEIARFHDGRLSALYNGAAVAYPDDRPGDWYGKQRLLPFAEGLPFGELLGHDPFGGSEGGGGSGGVLQGVGKFRPGPRPTVFEVAGARIGVLICYEGMYPGLPARYRSAGADALAVLTNDLWWGATAFPAWHASQAASVARTFEIPVLRAANGGISGAYGPDGRPTSRTPLFEVTAAVVEIPLAPPRIPWSADMSTWVPAAAAVGLIALAVLYRFRHGRRTA